MLARLGVVFLAAALAEPGAPPKPVGPDAVWSPPAGFVASVHAACDGRSGDEFGVCFVDRMRAAGASPPALDFAQRTGNLGYLRRFRDVPLVGVAWAEFPFRANANSVCFLVNGLPPMIDVDDLTATGGGGVHLAAMGSVWQAIAYGFMGLRPRRDTLVLDPKLPAAWRQLEVSVSFLGNPLRIGVDHDSVSVDATTPVFIELAGIRHQCRAGSTRIPFAQGGLR